MDSRDIKLSDVLVNYSTSVQKGDNVIIEYEGECCLNLVKQIIRDVYKAGGKPFVTVRDQRIIREVCMDCDEDQIGFMNQCLLDELKHMQASIAIRAVDNTGELSDVPEIKQGIYSRGLDEAGQYRVNNLKWVVLKYPNNSMAQAAGTSLDAFTDFFFDVCTMDYPKMSKAMDPLQLLMEKTDKVHLKGPGTDVTFSIKDIPSIKCDGKNNVPDGEVFTAPVRESINGVISYNTPSLYHGFTYENIKFEIKDGKIVKATANDTEKINEMLDTDDGSRYFGEFAMGVNPYVTEPMKDILFDEKIAGSFHFTPGMSYEEAPNGNSSAIHWDLVMIQRPEYGGGEIWFDDKLIRKDGIFVLPELEGLNPENLK